MLPADSRPSQPTPALENEQTIWRERCLHDAGVFIAGLKTAEEIGNISEAQKFHALERFARTAFRTSVWVVECDDNRHEYVLDVERPDGTTRRAVLEEGNGGLTFKGRFLDLVRGAEQNPRETENITFLVLANQLAYY